MNTKIQQSILIVETEKGKRHLTFFILLTPWSWFAGIMYRLRYGHWPRHGSIVIKRDGVFLVGRPCDFFEMILFDEPKTYRLIMKRCKRTSKGTFLDIGAHVGAYTMPIAKLGWKVIAVEPSPDTFRLLEYNSRLNRVNTEVVLFNAAIWEYNGTAWLHYSVSDSGTDSLLKVNHCGKVKVQTKSLSTLLKEVGEVDIAKMDIEGAETAVLKHAEDCLDRVGTWIIEVRRPHVEEVLKVLRERGYRCHIVEKLRRTHRTFNVVCYSN